MKNDIQFLLDKNIAHRGLHDIHREIAENSLSAFDRAVKAGFPIELDVHLTRDNQVVVFHDDSLLRVCGQDINVNTSDYKDIAGFPLLATSDTIPLFSDVLKLVSGKVPILLELKDGAPVGCLEECVLPLIRSYSGEIAVQAFSPERIYWFSKNAPDVTRGQLSYYYEDRQITQFLRDAYKFLVFNSVTNPHFVAYDLSTMPNPVIERLKKENMPVIAWTARTEEQYKNILHYSDSIIFESFTPAEPTIRRVS
ncbi:MAG: glycerophosphodiester phosphodiesterase family protein [Planctomycetia bacterium]|nr:glycerophosphodiester phosphodiesterase family protein [Planctomycetia bacterium]